MVALADVWICLFSCSFEVACFFVGWDCCVWFCLLFTLVGWLEHINVLNFAVLVIVV